MKTFAGLCTLALSLISVTGCSSSVDKAPPGMDGGGSELPSEGTPSEGDGAEACVVPTEKLSLRLKSADPCQQTIPYEIQESLQIEGSFEPVTGGFRVVSKDNTVELLDVEPAIPTGTLVRLTYACSPGGYGDPGASALLENVAAIDGKANPTEDGARLWYFVAAGGEAPIPEGFPFSHNFEEVCMRGYFEVGIQARLGITLSSADKTVTVEPGAEQPFTAPSGPHAGSYTVKNVNVTSIGHPGGDGTQDVNFSVTRAD